MVSVPAPRLPVPWVLISARGGRSHFNTVKIMLKKNKPPWAVKKITNGSAIVAELSVFGAGSGNREFQDPELAQAPTEVYK